MLRALSLADGEPAESRGERGRDPRETWKVDRGASAWRAFEVSVSPFPTPRFMTADAARTGRNPRADEAFTA